MYRVQCALRSACLRVKTSLETSQGQLDPSPRRDGKERGPTTYSHRDKTGSPPYGNRREVDSPVAAHPSLHVDP